MGIGQALTEATTFDDAGRQRNPHLLDYKLPTAADVPRIDIAWVETPALDGGPNGSKGMGEPPCVATPAAIANAIGQATATRVRLLPMTPERVWETLQ
jgi:CO/xanthine dehydrogenase Mo-binding subunit